MTTFLLLKDLVKHDNRFIQKEMVSNMKGLIARIEKHKTFLKLSRNIYLRAIKDGFISGMPVVLFFKYFYAYSICSKCIWFFIGVIK